MGESRLIEITSAINELDGPLSVMAYIASLSNSDVYLLIKYIGSSKYRNMNFAMAATSFSRDYLKSKTVLSEVEVSDVSEDDFVLNNNSKRGR